MLLSDSKFLLRLAAVVLYAVLSRAENPFASINPTTDLRWTQCYNTNATASFGKLSCARLLAPLDFANSSAGNIQLAIIKLASIEGNDDVQTIFYNPGGPGSDPVEAITKEAAPIRARVGDDVDVISVVPRGVGSTLPAITCDATNSIALRRLWEMSDSLPGYPPTSSQESYAIGQNIHQDCLTVTPDLLPYIGTVYAAHDLDYVRKALGHDSLLYLGDSYGTALGATYAALFPTRVYRMVLDGVLDLSNWYSAEQNPELDIGDADKALENFFTNCYLAGKEQCPLWSNSVEKIKQRFYEADQSIFKNAIPVPGYGLLKWPLWRSAVYSAMYKPAEGWPLLAGAVSEVLGGSAGPYITAAMKYISPQSSSVLWLLDPKTGLRNSPNAGTFIQCSDSGAPTGQLSDSQLSSIFNRYRGVSKVFGGVSSQYVIICDGAKMPSGARLRNKPKEINTAHPVLLVGNVADPTTPIINAHHMSEVFTGSRVLTVNGTGHLSFNAEKGSQCAKKWIAPYFRDGTLPPVGTVCEGAENPFLSGGTN